MKFLQVLILITIFIHSGSYKELDEQTYTESKLHHLYEKFDYVANMEPMECSRYATTSICRFDIRADAHFGTVMAILLLALFLMTGFIGGDSRRFDLKLHRILSKNKKRSEDNKPTKLVAIIIIFILALFTTKYIRSNDTNKVFNFDNKTLTVSDRDNIELKSYSFAQMKNIEILKYTDDKYVHYELNIRLEDKRLNLYAGSDDILCVGYASDLSKRLKIPFYRLHTSN